MKNYATIIIIIMALRSCNNEEQSNSHETFDDSQNQVKKIFPEKFYGTNFPDKDDVSSRFKKRKGKDMELYLISREIEDFNNDNIPDTIFFERIKEWNDPGDFHNIRLSISNQKDLTLFNASGWIKLVGSKYQNLRKIEGEGLRIENELVFASIAEDEKLIFLFGYVYASEAGVLTILNIKNGYDPKFIFNEKLYFVDVIDLNDDMKKELIVATDYEKTQYRVFELNLWLKENQALVAKVNK